MRKEEVKKFFVEAIKDCAEALQSDDENELLERMEEFVDWVAGCYTLYMEDEEDQAIADKNWESDVPKGYDTIIHYLYKEAPEYLDTLEDPFHDTTRLGFKMMAFCRNAGFDHIKVPAPRAFKGQTTDVNAYPEKALRMAVHSFIE